MIRIALILNIFLVLSITAKAAIKTWTNASTDGLWSNSLNWSGGVPVAADDVVFDGTSNTNCDINSNITVNSITIATGYTSTLTQGAGFTITDNGDFNQQDGIFLGGSANVRVSGTLLISGGVFTSTTASVIAQNFTLNPTGTFNHNNGTFIFIGSGNILINAVVDLYNLTINASNNIFTSLTVASILTVNNNFSLGGTGRNNINNGKIICKGNFTNSSTHAANSSTGTLEIGGNANQTITSNVTYGQGELPNFVINKTGGTATFNGIFSFCGDYTYTAGNTDYSTNSAIIYLGNGSCNVVGTHTLYRLTLGSSLNSSYNFTGVYTCEGVFVTNGSGRCNVDNGKVVCLHNFVVNNTFAGNGGTGTIEISGTANQNIIANASLSDGEIPNFVINKSGGTATFSGILSIGRDLTYLAGNTDYATNASTIAMTYNSSTITGVQSYHNFRLHPSVNATFTFASSITAENSFVISSNVQARIDGATIYCPGNVVIANTSTNNHGNGTIEVNGSGNQSFTATSGVSQGQGEIPFVRINKTGGLLTFSGIISAYRDWTHIAGATDYATNSSTIALTGANQDLVGANVFYNLTTDNFGTSDIGILNNTDVIGTFRTEGPYILRINGPAILNCYGNVINTQSSSSNNGNGTINITGSANQYINSTRPIGSGEFPNITISKTGGTALFNGILSTTRNYTYSSGITNFVNNTATIGFTGTNQSITGNETFYNVTIDPASATVFSVNNDINIEGLLHLDGLQIISLNGPGVVFSQGNIRLSNTSNNCNGFGTIHFNGTGNQQVQSTVVRGDCEIPNVIINKPSGTLSFIGTISTSQDWTYLNGTVDYASSNSTIAFTRLNQSIFGTQTFENLYTDFVGFGSLNIQNDNYVASEFTFGSNQATHLNGPGELICQGNVNILNTNTACAGNGTLVISGTANQLMSSVNASADRGELPNIRIDKTGGTLTCSGTINFNQNFEFRGGTVDATTNTSHFISQSTGATIDGEDLLGNTLKFYDFSFWQVNSSQTLTGNLEVDNQLDLAQTRLNMNGNEITINNPATNAFIASSNGLARSESTDNSGIINWNIGTTPGVHSFLFGAANVKIPFDFEVTDGGDVGIVSVATYPTAVNNTPYPSTPQTVTNLVNTSGANNATNVIDRFWQIDKSGPSGTATITFTYDQANVSAGVSGNEGQLEAQRYNTGLNKWEGALPLQTQNGASNRVSVPGVTSFSPWTLSLNTNPLPIELTNFEAKLNSRNEVNLTWQTASEINNDFFTIEKSKDGINFEFVAEIKGAGNSTTLLDYSKIDTNPFNGFSYYRLKQTDFDGQFEYSMVRQVEIVADNELVVYPNPASVTNGKLFIKSIESNLVNIKLIDIVGKTVYSNVVDTDNFIIDISKFSKGTYHLIVNTNAKRIVNKVVID